MMSRSLPASFRSRCIKVGPHTFTKIDVGRVRAGIANARCRHCNGYARALSGRPAKNPKGTCPDCKRTHARLEVLKKFLEKENLL